MHSFFLSIFLLCAAGLAYADSANALRLLKKDLGESIKVVSKREIRYCPDNTCDIIRSQKNTKFLPEFLYLYLFYESGYIELGKSFNKQKPFREIAIEEPEVRKQVAMFCPTSQKSPRCILDSMRSRFGIHVCSGRFDEGEFCVSCDNETTCKKL